MSKISRMGHRLYTGEVSYDFIGRRRLWYTVSAIILTISVLAVVLRGLTWGIEFSGGADFRAPTTVTSTSVQDMREALDASGVPELDEAEIYTVGDNQIRVQTRTLDPTAEVPKVRSAIANELGIPTDQVAYSLIGASWGGQITERALIALAVFFALVGIDALVGFTVTPATLSGVLTILGYSLYDTVVVFDKVRENTREIKASTTR